ncbi:MAG: hypothetical protein WCK28_19050, partial [Burkholderiales bacterium]
AGRVTIAAGGGGYAAPTVVAAPGRPGAAAASIEVRADTGDANAARPRVLVLADDASVRSAATAATRNLATDPAVQPVDPATGEQRVELRVGATALAPIGAQAGSLSLSARDRIRIDGVPTVTASRSLQVSTAEIEVAASTPQARLAAPAVQVGQPISQSLPVVATPATGDARLSIEGATTVDVVGRLAVSGARRVDVRSDGDIRFSGQYEQVATPVATSTGALSVASDLSLTAQRIYPTTLSSFTVRSTLADGRITLGASGPEAATPLSALGSLTLSADTVSGQARLYAPLGALAIEASRAIDLAAGSVLSVSGQGTVVPVGQSLSGFDWVYQVDASNRAPIAGLPDKAVSLSAPSVDLRDGARIDVRGGGDIVGREFIRGQVGSVDVLAAPNVFAVLPAGGPVVPRDAAVAIEDAAARTAGTAAFRGALPASATVQASTVARPGDTITVAESPLLAAGTYTLLPARYGLLPGARLVVLARSGSVPKDPTSLGDGSWWVGAYRGNAAGERDAAWSSAAVMDGAALARWARYEQSTGGTYFAAAAADGAAPANAAADAGRLSVEGRTRMALAGTLSLDGGAPLSIASDGRVAEAATRGARGTLELSADRLSVGGEAAPGVVGVAPAFVEALLPRTLSLGVTTASNGTPTIRATEVEVGAGVRLAGEQVIVGAADRVRIGAGASLAATASGAAPAADTSVVKVGIAGNGALVGALGDAGATLARVNGGSAGGAAEIASGARLAGARVELDAGRLAVAQGAAVEASDVRIAGDRLRFGDGVSTDPGTSAFSAAQAASLSSRARFEANAATDIALAGTVRLGAESTELLRLRAGAITGETGAAASLRAARVELAGTAAPRDDLPTPGTGTGTLAVTATGASDPTKSGVILTGNTVLSGFGAYSLTSTGPAPGRVVLDGTGSLRTDARTTVTAGAIVGTASADFAVATAGPLVVRGATGGDAAAGAGARIAVTAPSIDLGAAVVAPSGSITLQATGAGADGGVVLRQGASLDASGATARVFDQRLDASGGRVTVSADAGNVVAERGVTIDVSAAPTATGGTVAVSAVEGALLLGLADGTGVLVDPEARRSRRGALLDGRRPSAVAVSHDGSRAAALDASARDGGAATAASRDWLERSSGFSPQPRLLAAGLLETRRFLGGGADRADGAPVPVATTPEENVRDMVQTLCGPRAAQGPFAVRRLAGFSHPECREHAAAAAVAAAAQRTLGHERVLCARDFMAVVVPSASRDEGRPDAAAAASQVRAAGRGRSPPPTTPTAGVEAPCRAP